jgi:23S rRNA (guanosine2251-2'-O)-methyltransferase
MAVLAGFHPVREALRAGASLERLLVVKGANPRLQEIVDLARGRGIPVRFEPREALDRLAPGVPHQGVVALGAAAQYRDLDDVIENATCLVLLDGVEDPHNLGAIVRTAHAAGASAVVIPERRAAGLTETVAKAAAGALAWLPVVRITNLSRAIEAVKKRGFWVYGVDERGPASYAETAYASPCAFVFGAEGKGLHQQVRDHCDFLVRIPLAGTIASLNVSVSAGVVLFEWRRRGAGSEKPA